MGRGTVDIQLPDLGDVDSATVVAWLRDVGARVEEGDDLVEVETEKTTFIVPSPASGTLVGVSKMGGSQVHVGDVLGTLETA